mmetsp:Transcript_18976/g.44222  ORF Transcript_18976/g.44222 Transcript_18976/m.44222 type:complete len:230 (-) Transcript_18976:404-1093(-)
MLSLRRLYNPMVESVCHTTLSFSMSAKTTLRTSWSNIGIATVGRSVTSSSSCNTCRIETSSSRGRCWKVSWAAALTISIGAAPLESTAFKSALAAVSILTTTGGIMRYRSTALCRGVLPITVVALTLARASNSIFTTSGLPPASTARCKGVLDCLDWSATLTSAFCSKAAFTSTALPQLAAANNAILAASFIANAGETGTSNGLPVLLAAADMPAAERKTPLCDPGAGI